MDKLCPFKICNLFFVLALTSLMLLVSAAHASAATVKWDGGGANNNWSTSANWVGDAVPGTGDIATFDGTSVKSSTVDLGFAGEISGIDINSGYTGTITLGRDLIIGSGGYAQDVANFNGGSYDIDLNGSFTLVGGNFVATGRTFYVSGNFTHTAGGTFTSGSGTVNFDGATAGTLDVNASENFYNVIFSKTGGFDLTIGAVDMINVTNDLNFSVPVGSETSDTLGGIFRVSKNVTVRGSCGTSEIKFIGTTNQYFDLTGAASECDGIITVNNTGGTVYLLSDFIGDLPGQKWTAWKGNFDMNGYNFTIRYKFEIYAGNFYCRSGAFVTNDLFYMGGGTFNASTSTTTIRGAVTKMGGTFNPNGGTVVYTGDGDGATDTFLIATLSSNYNNLTIDSTDTAVEIFELDANLDIDGNFTITKGIVDASASNYEITVAGNFANGGVFTARGGTVTFDNSSLVSAISGSINFYNFTCTESDKTLEFAVGSTQTISGTITITGTEGHYVGLRSTSAGVRWGLIAGAFQSINYADVRDSDASGGVLVNPGVGSLNTGNNLGWAFMPQVTFSIESAGFDEGVGSFTVSADLTNAYLFDVTVPFGISGGAILGTDYTISSADSLVIPAGSMSSFVIVTVLDDTVDESNETLVLGMGVPVNATVGAITSYTATILDNDEPPVIVTLPLIAVSDVSVSEGVGTATLTLTMTGVSASDVTVDFATSDSTAIAGSDYTVLSGTVTWAAGETGAKTLSVAILEDTTDESDETFSVNLSNPIASTVSDDIGILTITDNDEPVVVSSGGGGGGGGGGGSSRSSTKKSEDVDEEADNVTLIEVDMSSVYNSLTILIPDHWSIGYMRNLVEEDYVVELASRETAFLNVLDEMFKSPDMGMIRAKAVELLVVFSRGTASEIPSGALSQTFTDVSLDHEQSLYIEYAVQAGLIHGYPDGTFGPSKILNRAEILKMCMYFFNRTEDSGLRGDNLLAAYNLTENPFSDVDLNAWYAPYVIEAYHYGVIKGYGDGTFGPEKTVSNAEFLKIATLSQSLEEAVELASELE
ncbi:MAG: S-layer homology domain-containing protein [Candidatus Gracilibacteria bacterium]